MFKYVIEGLVLTFSLKRKFFGAILDIHRFEGEDEDEQIAPRCKLNGC